MWNVKEDDEEEDAEDEGGKLETATLSVIIEDIY